MIKFIAGLLIGLSITTASADFLVQQPNGTFAVIKATVVGGVNTIVVACQ